MSPTIAPFVMVPASILDAGLTPQAITLYLALRRHADNRSGETWLWRERLAGYLGLRKTASVDRYTRELADAGLIGVSDRWCSKVDRRDWVATKDSDHTIQGSNLYTIIAGRMGSLSRDAGGPAPGTQGVPQRGHDLDSLIHNPIPKGKTTRSTAMTLPVDWEPNAQHLAEALRLGANLDAVAAKFREGMTASGESRKNWGATFMAYLRAEVEGLAERTFTAVDAAAAEMATAAIVDRTFRSLQAAVPVDEGANSPASEANTAVSAYREAEAALSGRSWARRTPDLVALAESLAVDGHSRYAIMRAIDDADAAARRAGRVA